MATAKTLEEFAEALGILTGDPLFRKMKSAWFRANRTRVPAEITKTMSSGTSPVAGKGKYKKYSATYRAAIANRRYSKYRKSVTPVNLKLSGAMHKSIEMVETERGIAAVSDSETFVYHNWGTKNMPERRILPAGNGFFRKEINVLIERSLTEVMDKTIDVIVRRYDD